MKLVYIVSLTMLIPLTMSCTTFYLTTDSLRDQFSGIDSTELITVTVRGPLGERHNYLANPINSIICTDKNGQPAHLNNSPSIEMRVTTMNGKRTIFYFDRILVTDSVMYGVQSRFLPSAFKKKIALKDVKKIEVQDGKKNFEYVRR